jgi:hypothetical protein
MLQLVCQTECISDFTFLLTCRQAIQLCSSPASSNHDQQDCLEDLFCLLLLQYQFRPPGKPYILCKKPTTCELNIP